VPDDDDLQPTIGIRPILDSDLLVPIEDPPLDVTQVQGMAAVSREDPALTLPLNTRASSAAMPVTPTPQPEPPNKQVVVVGKAGNKITFFVETLETLKKQGVGIVLLVAFVLGVQFDYIVPGPNLGGPDKDYLNVLHAKIGAVGSQFEAKCGAVKDDNEQLIEDLGHKLHDIKRNATSMFRARVMKDRQRYTRILHVLLDAQDNACAYGNKKWRKKYLDEANRLLDDDDPDPLGLRGTDNAREDRR
jgi:hypothetical protein